MSRRLVSVLIPARDEQDAVGDVVRAVRRTLRAARVPYEVLVVDDGSRDATAREARRAGAAVLSLGARRGYGAALKAGLSRARGGVVVMLDADGTYQAEELPGLLSALRTADLVVGARVGKQAAVPLLRRPAKALLALWARWLAGRPIPDLNSGLRAFRKDAALRFLGFYPEGFSFTSTQTLAFECRGLPVAYVPVRYLPRVGKSKIRPLRDTVNFFTLVLRTATAFHPLKVFLPVGGVLAATAAAYGAFTIWTQRNVSDATTLLFLTGLQIVMLGLLADLVVRRTP